MTVDGGLQVDPADALERADAEGVDGDQGSRMRGFAVALAEFGREAPEETDLLLRELDFPLGRGLLQPTRAAGAW